MDSFVASLPPSRFYSSDSVVRARALSGRRLDRLAHSPRPQGNNPDDDREDDYRQNALHDAEVGRVFDDKLFGGYPA
jgi:hypothetical protein